MNGARSARAIFAILGMHLTQVTTMGWGCNCRALASEMRRQRASVQRASPDGLAPQKTVTVGLIGHGALPTHAAGVVPGNCCEPRSVGNKILGLPESSAYPASLLSETVFRHRGISDARARRGSRQPG